MPASLEPQKRGCNSCKFIISTIIYNYFNGKPSPTTPAPKPSPNQERLPNWEGVIQTRPTPSIHSCLLRHLENTRLYVYLLYLLQYTFCSMKNPTQRVQEQNRARASPSGTACLIGKNLISLAPWSGSAASSRSPSSAKTSQMDLLYPATPKI